MLEREFKYYLDHQPELLEKYSGRVVVIKDDGVIGDYYSYERAVAETSKVHELGTFLVQKCTEGDKDYTAVFHSRVRIPHAAV